MASPGTAPSTQHGIANIQPRGGRIRPVAQAIQLAMWRIEKGDTQPRIVKFGEMIARRALAGEEFFVKLVADRLDGVATPLDDKGEPVDLQSVVVRQLVELLHERRTAKAVDVVAEMVEKE